MIKRTKKESDREANTNTGKTEQLTKIDLFKDLLLLKSESAKLIEVWK
jgi:hypothetical protein